MSTTLTKCENTQVSSCSKQTTMRPAADVYETNDAWLLILEMPGVDERGVDVSIEKNVLTVTGTTDSFDTDGYELKLGHQATKSYERSFRLPDDVDRSAVDAQVKNGVLQLRLPKAATAMPHKVTVKAG